MTGRWSLRTRLLASLAVLAAGLFALGAIQNYAAYRDSSQRLFDDSLRESANLLLQLAEHEMLEHGGILGEALLRTETSTGPYGFRFQIWTPAMQQSFHAQKLQTRPLQEFSIDGLGWTDIGGERWRSYSSWNGSRTLQIQIAQRAEQRDSLNRSVLLRLIAEATLLLAIACALIWWIVTATIRPLQQLADTVGRRGEHDLGVVEAQEAPREVEPLVEALNRLLLRVGRTLHLERRFTADAAHELRTPLAAIRANAQVLVAARDEPEREATARDLISSVDRNTRLVEQLLALARADQPKSASDFQPLDLSQIVAEQLAAVRTTSKAQELDIQSSLPACTVRGDSVLLAAMTRNIIDNAMRYTPPGGRVLIETGTRGSNVTLTVEDTGPGIPPEERTKVFERFYRLSERNTPPGSGLGLSIAQRIAELHEGRIELESGSGDQGTRIRIVLPLAHQPG